MKREGRGTEGEGRGREGEGRRTERALYPESIVVYPHPFPKRSSDGALDPDIKGFFNLP
jgi:hypothetical protein